MPLWELGYEVLLWELGYEVLLWELGYEVRLWDCLLYTSPSPRDS